MAFHPAPGLEVAGRYRLLRRSGGGAFGAVWEGESLEDGRPVLLELLRGEGVGQRAVSHVWRAAMLVERAEHPGAVGISDVVGEGKTQGLLAIAVVPLVPGPDLDAWLRERPRTLAEAIEVVREVVDVLESAHASLDSRGHPDPLLHLGLKPSEVVVGDEDYVGPRGNTMRVRVLDFGLVRDHVEEDATGTMASISSPRFESPESFAYPELQGPWSDVWAIGVMLHAIATGRYPFSAQDDVTPFQIQRHILDRRSEPLHWIDESLPRDLSDLVDRCLARNPSNRFEDASDLAFALDALEPIDPSLPAHAFPRSARVSDHAGESMLDSLAPVAATATHSRYAPARRGRASAAGIALASVIAAGASAGMAYVAMRGSAEGAQASMTNVARPLVGAATGVAFPAPLTTRVEPAAELVASNPFRTVLAPDAAQVLGCERDPVVTNLLVEGSVAQIPIRPATITTGVLAGLARRNVCDATELRDASGQCMVLGCPPGAIGPDATGRCVATRTARGPIQRCFRRASAKYSLVGATHLAMQEHEVTWSELGRFVVGHGGAAFVGVDPATGAPRGHAWDGTIADARADLPAQGVPRDLAIAYCTALGARLPTEAEFETAARGRSFASAPWGHATATLGTQLFALGAPGTAPHPVRARGSLDHTIADDPIYDLVGNVREWTSDAYAPDAPFGSVTNALPEDLASSTGLPLSFGVVRGLPLSIPKGWPRLARPRDVEALLPVPAAYRAPMCADAQPTLDRPGSCLATSTGYLAALRDVGFRCVRGTP